MFLFRLFNYLLSCSDSFVHKCFIEILGNNRYYRLISFIEGYFIKKQNKSILTTSEESYNPSKLLVLMFDEYGYQTGLADRLRAIASVYHWCANNNFLFKVYFNHPFNLSDYLIPNKYDWVITKSELNKITNKEVIALYSYSQIFKDANRSVQLAALNNLSDKDSSTICLYSNTCCYQDFFSNDYNILFKLSDELYSKYNTLKNQLGESYISLSFRFAQLLGDLKDTYGKPLSVDEKNHLIEKCYQSISELLEKNNCSVALITSDSTTFLEYASKHPRVYIIPGEVGHIANDGYDSVILKTIMDWYMISSAKKAYMVRTKEMYRSGFARLASSMGKVPFEEILL